MCCILSYLNDIQTDSNTDPSIPLGHPISFTNSRKKLDRQVTRLIRYGYVWNMCSFISFESLSCAKSTTHPEYLIVFMDIGIVDKAKWALTLEVPKMRTTMLGAEELKTQSRSEECDGPQGVYTYLLQ